LTLDSVCGTVVLLIVELNLTVVLCHYTTLTNFKSYVLKELNRKSGLNMSRDC